jgi:hypothetical protein
MAALRSRRSRLRRVSTPGDGDDGPCGRVRPSRTHRAEPGFCSRAQALPSPRPRKPRTFSEFVLQPRPKRVRIAPHGKTELFSVSPPAPDHDDLRQRRLGLRETISKPAENLLRSRWSGSSRCADQAVPDALTTSSEHTVKCVKNCAEGRADWKKGRDEGSTASSRAPGRRKQLSHSGDHCRRLARFARARKAFVTLTQPRIASDEVENHYRGHLAQASGCRRDCQAAREKRFFPDCRSRSATPT